MTATYKGERKGRREADRDIEGTHTYRRVFQIGTDNAQDGADIVLAALSAQGIDIGTPYSTDTENDFEALVRELTPVQLPNTATEWDVNVFYSTIADEQDEDPLARPVDVTWTFETFRVIANAGVGEAGDPSPILNAAGEAFDPPPQIDESRQILIVTRNENTIDPILIRQFQNATNAQPWLGAEEREIRIKGIVARKMTNNRDPNNKYWRVTYTFVLNEKTWDLVLLNQGTYFIDADDGNKKKSFTTEQGQPYVGLVTAFGDEAEVGGETFETIVAYKTKDFSVLNLEKDILDQLENKRIR
jgi:hypothetical protein